MALVYLRQSLLLAVVARGTDLRYGIVLGRLIGVAVNVMDSRPILRT